MEVTSAAGQEAQKQRRNTSQELLSVVFLSAKGY